MLEWMGVNAFMSILTSESIVVCYLNRFDDGAYLGERPDV